MNKLIAAFITGQSGEGAVFLLVREGRIEGADLQGVEFEGEYQPVENGFKCNVGINVTKSGMLVQGKEVPEGFSYSVNFHLPTDFDALDYVTVSTPFGPVNSRFRTLKDMKK